MSKKNVLLAVLGGCGVVVLAGAVFVGAIVYAVVRHLDVRPVSAATAGQEYDRLHARFAGQVPLIEIDRDNVEKVRVNRLPERGGSGEISAIHIFAWDPRDRKLVRLDLPFWLLRLQPHSNSVHWNWRGDDLGLDKVQLSIDDIERHGPGLLLDFEGRRGERVLLWSE